MRARLRITQWNAPALTRRVSQILKEYGAIAGAEASKQIVEQQWPWDRGTLRFVSRFQAGERRGKGVWIQPGLRDIVDTGELLNSQTPPTVRSGGGVSRLTIEWTAPYSGVVQRGGDYGSYVNANGVLVDPGVRPGRDWVAATLRERPFLPYLVQRWNALAGGGRRR